MKFEYEPIPIRGGGVNYQPRVDIVFTNPCNGKQVAIKSLVDSGAGMTVINGQFAELLDVDLEAGRPRRFYGITSSALGYDHKLRIRVKQDKRHEFLITCAFLPGLQTDALLGQNGFFENYKVIFERYKNSFQVIPRRT
jgi:hypothetical protein